jgi:hypothetical protein
MAVTYYTSADASAPVLSGQNDALRQLLKAILVDGYGAKAAAGWTQEYSGTNKAVFRPGSGTRFRLRILDDGSLAAAAREAVVRGAESASDVDTLTDPFPTVALHADSACVWRKSDTADSTARSWWCVADASFFVLYVRFAGTSGDTYFFGDVVKLYSTDAYNCAISRRDGNSSSNDFFLNSGSNADLGTANSMPYIYVARTVNGVTKSEGAMIWRAGDDRVGYAGSNFPYPGNGAKLPLGPIILVSAGQGSGTQSVNKTIRGYVPYCFEPLVTSSPTNLAHEDTFTASAYDASSSFVILSSNALTDTRARIALQTAGTFDP